MNVFDPVSVLDGPFLPASKTSPGLTTLDISAIVGSPHSAVVASMRRHVDNGHMQMPTGSSQRIRGHLTTVYTLDDRSALIVASGYGGKAFADVYDATQTLPPEPVEPVSTSRRATVEAVYEKTGTRYSEQPLEVWCKQEQIKPTTENGYTLWPASAWFEVYVVDLGQIF